MIAFQPVRSARVLSRCRCSGVKMNSAQSGAVSPVEVQNVAFSTLPPQRITPGPRVRINCGRLPVVMVGVARPLSGKEKPRYRLGRAAPAVVPMVTVVDGGVVRAIAEPAPAKARAAPAAMVTARVRPLIVLLRR